MHHALTSFIGRRRELSQLEALFASFRAAVILGTGGLGKSRLATEYVRTSDASAILVDVRAMTDFHALEIEVCRHLSLTPAANEERSVQIASALRVLGALTLVLDNFEPLADDAPSLVSWLQEAPELRLLLTSRVRLEIAGAASLELAPLDLEAAQDEGSDAARLFLERAAAHSLGPEVAGGPEVAKGTEIASRRASATATVENIVSTLDGHPLAIELAAQQTRLMGTNELLRRLQTHDPQRRQNTAIHEGLRRSLDRSWQLLSGPERHGLLALSEFRGGFSLEGAEFVISKSLEAEECLDSALEVFQALRDQSLVYVGQAGAKYRFGIYEPVREFIRAKTVGPASAHREPQTADWLAQWIESLPLLAEIPVTVPVLHQRVAEAQNIAAAFDNALARKSPKRILRTALLHAEVLHSQGFGRLSVDGLTRAFAALDGFQEQRVVQCRRFLAFAAMRDLDQAREAFSLITGDATLPEPTSDPELLELWASWHRLFGEKEEAESLFRRALIAAEHVVYARPRLRSNLAGILVELGRLRDAESEFERTLIELEAWPDIRLESYVLANLGLAKQERGDFLAAQTIYLRALSLHRELNSVRFEGITLCDLGGLAFEQGRFNEARVRYQQGISKLKRVGDSVHEAIFTSAMSVCELCLGMVAPALAHRDVAQESMERRSDAVFTAANRWYERAHWHVLTLRGDAQNLPSNRPTEELPTPSSDADEVRLARRIFHRLESMSAKTTLRVTRDGTWFSVSDGDAGVELVRRPNLARMVAALVAGWFDGEQVSADALIEVGWPGELMAEDSGSNRLHVALSTLRRVGLSGLIEREGDAYRFAAGVFVVIEEL